MAMSRRLADRSVDHVVLERGEVADSWRRQRWDSFTLLTPNWQTRLPGHGYEGDYPDGFMTGEEVVRFIDDYALRSGAPVLTGVEVTAVCQDDGGYAVVTEAGVWSCRAVVLASGACNLASLPECAHAVPPGIMQVNPLEYRHPAGHSGSEAWGTR